MLFLRTARSIFIHRRNCLTFNFFTYPKIFFFSGFLWLLFGSVGSNNEKAVFLNNDFYPLSG